MICTRFHDAVSEDELYVCQFEDGQSCQRKWLYNYMIRDQPQIAAQSHSEITVPATNRNAAHCIDV